jgi:hypothetical protein
MTPLDVECQYCGSLPGRSCRSEDESRPVLPHIDRQVDADVAARA